MLLTSLRHLYVKSNVVFSFFFFLMHVMFMMLIWCYVLCLNYSTNISNLISDMTLPQKCFIQSVKPGVGLPLGQIINLTLSTVCQICPFMMIVIGL